MIIYFESRLPNTEVHVVPDMLKHPILPAFVTINSVSLTIDAIALRVY